MKKKIDINSDENADWIKLVHDGKYQRQELEIHAQMVNEHSSSKRFVLKSRDNQDAGWDWGVWDNMKGQWWGPFAHAVFTNNEETAKEQAERLNKLNDNNPRTRQAKPQT